MKHAIVVFALGALLLLAACSNQEPDQGTGQVVGVPVELEHQAMDEKYKGTVKTFEILLEQTVDEDGDVVSERLFPRTLNARVGDTIELVFVLDDQKFVTIDGINFAERVQNDVVEFVVEEAGVMSIMVDGGTADETLLIIE